MMTLVVAAVAVAPGIVTAAELTVEERAAGIAAVEKLRHGSRLGAQVPVFEQNYPDEVWRDRSMELGALLDAASARHGFTEVVAALDREARRIGDRSRAPHRLDAMRAALGHEPSKIRECLVLPRVAHMLDELIAGDRPAPGVAGPKSELWEWWVSPMVFEGRQFHTAVWTGNEMIVWGGRAGDVVNTGGIYEPATDTWLPTSLVDAPSPRSSHTAVWADGLMIVWGGYDGDVVGDGGRLDPVTNVWISMTTDGAPAARAYHAAVWTGSRMFLWGGGDGMGAVGTGGLYEPVSDEWTDVTVTNAPLPRYEHAMVWTGSEAIVWVGTDAVVQP